MTTKVKLLKGFTHHGKTYKEGDEFEGTPDEIATLSRQGFCKDPNTEEGGEESDKSTEADKTAPHKQYEHSKTSAPPEPPRKAR